MDADERLVVELDILSGQPNPSWTLTGATAKAWRARLDGAADPSAPPAPGADGLGYRGLIVRGPGGPWRVAHGRVERGGRAFVDEGAEQALLATMPEDLRGRFGAALP